MVEAVAEVLEPRGLESASAAPTVGDVTPRKCDMPEARKRKGKSRISQWLVPSCPTCLVQTHGSGAAAISSPVTSSKLNGSATVAERAVIRRIAVLETEMERRESMFAKAGEASDSALDVYQRASGNHRRLLESIGINKSKPQQNAEAD